MPSSTPSGTPASLYTAGVSDPLVNVVVDQVTFEHHLAVLAGVNIPPLDPQSVERRSPDMFVESCSTQPGWSSISAADHDCSPVAPATPCCSEIDGVSGPDAVFAPGAAKPTTPNPG
jgi:hypothetical protein